MRAERYRNLRQWARIKELLTREDVGEMEKMEEVEERGEGTGKDVEVDCKGQGKG